MYRSRQVRSPDINFSLSIRADSEVVHRSLDQLMSHGLNIHSESPLNLAGNSRTDGRANVWGLWGSVKNDSTL